MGLGLAMVMRLLLLAFISWILKLDQTLFSAFEIDFSGKLVLQKEEDGGSGDEEDEDEDDAAGGSEVEAEAQGDEDDEDEE